MNKIFSFFCLLLFASTVFSQNDYATIYLYRPQAFTIAADDVRVLINDVQVCVLKNGSALEYKVFDVKNTKISIVDGLNNVNYTNLNLQKNKTYLFNIKARLPRALGFKLEDLDKPIKDKKIKDFIRLTDVGVLGEIAEREKPDTDWTKEKLISHWEQNGISDIEGIYERVSAHVEYKLAVLKENGDYKIIYLAGARGTGWREGDIKASLQKTAQFGIFKSGWYMLNKNYNKDVIVTFENASMKSISETGSGQDIYLKMYPTYDDNTSTSQSLTSSWKSSGTGFFIDKKGYLVTNYHVIKEGNIFEVDVTKNGQTKSFEAKLISSDKQNDLAILKITSPNFKPLDNLGYNFNTNIQDVGSSVFALGYPLTQLMGNEIKFTDGKISSKSGFQGDITTYQISVPIQPGNSGGPLFDEKGNLIGITSSQ